MKAKSQEKKEVDRENGGLKQESDPRGLFF